ncbi:GNAT family N-acetyltransferase [Aeromonas veronii]|uniref:GNAT family N-acetyltransferase n=1 Tax=Aeromonas veronii TaxID=654 RepID=UPI001F19A8EA|nr:GNAT family N-acetyltransferase [Aeromonas veronii]
MKPDLTGTRILLRTIGPQDAADLFEIYGNPLTMEFASDPCRHGGADDDERGTAGANG